MIQKPDVSFIAKPGKLPAIADPRNLNVLNYVDMAKLQNVPLQLDWTLKKKTPWRMMRNWTLSDCTCAAAGHMIECWTANTTKENIIHDRDVIAAFIALTGYDPATGKNDNPVYLSAAMKYWRKNGIGGHKIKAYATINYKDHNLVRACVYLFGGIYIGVNLPNSMKGQEIWDVMPGGLTGDNSPGSFGGHAVNIVAYDDQYLTCVSWGKTKKMTWAFWDAYCDELYAIITEDFFNESKTPQGLDLSSLETDLLSITKAKKTLQKQLITNHTKMNKQEKSEMAAGKGGGKGGTKASELKAAPKQKAVAAGTSGGKGGIKGNELKAAPKQKAVAAGNGGKKS